MTRKTTVPKNVTPEVRSTGLKHTRELIEKSVVHFLKKYRQVF
jgi:hypothetical protein